MPSTQIGSFDGRSIIDTLQAEIAQRATFRGISLIILTRKTCSIREPGLRRSRSSSSIRRKSRLKPARPRGLHEATEVHVRR